MPRRCQKSVQLTLRLALEGVTACGRIGQFHPDEKWYLGQAPEVSTSGAVNFVAICLSSGGKANPEAFRDFTLKNGWKVKQVTVTEGAVIGMTSGWRWIVKPSEGSDNPGMQMHVWADLGGRRIVPVWVHIEGPEGTSPYVASAR